MAVPAIIHMEATLHGAGWPSSTLAWGQPSSQALFWASFSDEACPILPPKTQWPCDQGGWQHLMGGAPGWALVGAAVPSEQNNADWEKRGSDFQRLSRNWPRFNLPHWQQVVVFNSLSALFICTEKSWLMFKGRCFVDSAIKQGLLANHPSATWTASLHNWSRYLFYFILYGLLFQWKRWCVDW